jgi:glycosyltransferase involved in cell wall biosynthesis
MQEHTSDETSKTPVFPKKRNGGELSVGYFTPGWPPETFANGIVTYVASIAEGMRELGHQPHVLTYHLERSDVFNRRKEDVFELSSQRRPSDIVGRLSDIVAARIHRNWVFRSNFVRGLCKGVETLMTSPGLDLLEIEESFGLADVLRTRLSIPIVVRLHGPWFLNGKVVGASQEKGFMRRVQDEGQAIANAFVATADSHDVLEQTRQYYQIPLEQAVVIPCPVAPTPPEQRWQPHHCEPNVIGFIGRFDRHKGGDLIIDAFAQVLQDCPSTRLVFLGPDRGYTDAAGRTWQLEEYVRDRLPGALETGQVELLGQQPPSALTELRRRAQITVVASRYDNFPYTALEALSLGCPIVAARAGGIPEIITDGVTGLLFKTGDAADLAVQLGYLLKNPELAAKLGHQAAESCAERFAPVVVAKQSSELYQETLARWSHNRS